MKKSTTKRALFLSFVSMFLCFTMLLGTTYAWFTDSVTSGVNTIVAGNLDVELEYAKVTDGARGAWTPVQDAKEIFDPNAKWEPGHAEVVYLRVSNLGNLALKYQLSFNVIDATEVTVDGQKYSFADMLKVALIKDDPTTPITPTREYVKGIDAKEWYTLQTIEEPGQLLADADLTDADKPNDVYLVVVYWEPSDKDNFFNINNDRTDGPVEAHLGVNLFATQMEAESDSFGSNYDAGAPWTGGQDISWYDPAATEYVLDSAEDLAGLAAIVNGTAESPVTTFAASGNATVHDDFAGKIVKLEGDINLKGIEWTPIGRIGVTSTDFTYSFKGTFDGNGHTIYNLKVSNEGWAGLFGIAHSATIKGLNVVGVEIESNRMTGAIVGQLYGSIDNCHVKDAKITVVPNVKGDSFDNGDKVGGIVGWLGDNGNNRTLTGCSAEDVTIKAYRDVGGIAGYVASSTTVNNNSAKSVTINVDQTTNHYGTKDFNAGYIFGRTGGTIVEGTNSVDEGVVDEEKMSSIDTKYMLGGAIVKIDPETEGVVLYKLPETFEEDTFNVPAGVESIGGYAFAYNKNVETIVLPSTVTTLNDRAFRDTSASTVVLNEGLENISYQAFRNALNVKEVVIPSTVTTISKEAFQHSGVETLTIPANVTTIEYGGLRDMKMLETVVIEGNVDIPVYAFRACTNLKTVIIKGDDVTFGGGSRGMIFTNKEDGDGSAITVFVANDTVKERLLAADTAAKDYGGYKIVVGGTPVVSAEDLANALVANKKVVLIDDIDATTGIIIPEGASLDGNGHTITYLGTEDDYGLVKLNTSATIKNVTLKNYRVRTETATNGVVTMENVVINMDNDLTGLDVSRGAGTAKLTNVTCKGITDATHLDPNTQVQVDYTPYGDVLLGTKWGLEAYGCTFGSLHGWNTTNGSNVSLNNTTCTVFRMHYWSNRTLYVNGVETAWSESGAIPVAHDVGGCWSVQPAFK